MVPVYGVFTVAFGGVPTVSVAPCGLTVSATLPVVVFAGLAASVARTATVLVPAVLGVPVIWQLAPSVRPAGSVPLVIVQA